MKEHKIIVFSTGICQDTKENILNIKNSNFNDEQKEKVDFFYLRGGFDLKKLSFIDKFLMLIFKLKLKIKKDLTNDEKDLLNIYNKPIDFCKRDNIHKLIDFVTSKT